MIFPNFIDETTSNPATWLRPGLPGRPRQTLSVTDATDYADRMLYDITYNIIE